MARKPRIIGKDACHHVYAWGNNRHAIFKSEQDYRKYLKYLEIYSGRFHVDVVCYALMAWHVHLSLFDCDGKLSRFMRGLHGRYAQYYNRTTGNVGHVFGERYNNRIVRKGEDNVWLSRYIHRQAVEAGIVNHPRDYRWSSYAAYVGLSPTGFLKPRLVLDQFGAGESAFQLYENFVMGEDDGPIDWGESAPSATGDDRSGVGTGRTGILSFEECPDESELLGEVAVELGVSYPVLLDPRGRRERSLRHEAFSILVRRYGLSVSRVSRLFGVTHRTVAKVVWL